MDSMTFISNLVSSLAWPISIIFLIILFRRPLSLLLPNLSQLQYGKLKANFGKKLEDVDNKSQKIPVTPQQPSGLDAEQNLRNTLLDIVKRSPTAAILEAWRNIEVEFLRFKEQIAPDQKYISPLFIINRLSENELIDKELKVVIDELRIVRNEVAHTRGRLVINENQAITYIQSSIRVIEYLKFLVVRQE